MIKTLIIEDDPMVLQINERFLNKVQGFEHIGSVQSLNDAKQKILELDPDLILLDIFFSTGKGVDVIQWLRKQDMDVDVIFITADRSPQTIERAFRFGAIDYLVKPFRFDRFEEALFRYKKLRETIDESENLDQSLIDQIHAGATQIERQTTGVDLANQNQTQQDILKVLEKNEAHGYTAQEIADALGISRITARRYLDEMESDGRLELYLEYGKVGRPRNKYRLIQASVEESLE